MKKKPNSFHLDVLRRMAAAGQPLVCRPPRDRWCVADSAADTRTPRVHRVEEFYVGFQTAMALEQAGLVEAANYCLALSAHGRRTLSAAEEFKQSLERSAKDRWKRAAMMWLLRANGLTFRAIGAQMGPIGAGRVQQIVDWYERVLRHRAYVINERKGFEQRLAAAGAIPTLPRFSWDRHPMNVHFLDMDLPDEEES